MNILTSFKNAFENIKATATNIYTKLLPVLNPAHEAALDIEHIVKTDVLPILAGAYNFGLKAYEFIKKGVSACVHAGKALLKAYHNLNQEKGADAETVSSKTDADDLTIAKTEAYDSGVAFVDAAKHAGQALYYTGDALYHSGKMVYHTGVAGLNLLALGSEGVGVAGKAMLNGFTLHKETATTNHLKLQAPTVLLEDVRQSPAVAA